MIVNPRSATTMAKSMRERYETGRERIKNDPDVSDTEEKLILEFLHANDSRRDTHQMPDGKVKSDGTLARYARGVGRVARDLEPDLTEATTYDINSLMDDYLNGNVEGIKDEGLANSSVRNFQGPMRRFYLYHDDLGVDREEIHFADQDESPVDERDMFSKEDVQALREEAKRRGSRDACLVDLLLYTGQRRSAILNLRLKDVKPEEDIFHLNEDDGDLKGANGKRPLLGANEAVRDWKRQHPTQDSADYLITHKHDQSNRDGVRPGDKLAPSTVYRQLKRIGKAAGVDKPVNAHNFRHYFVTVCKRDYGMDNDTIKHLIGHEPDSKVMERTYAHLTDEDHIEAAEVAQGLRDPDEESPLTPPVCDRCGEPLESDWKSCPYCGFVYAPDAQEAQEQVNDDVNKEYRQSGPENTETHETVDAIERALDDPEVKQALLERLSEE
ncbi:integrase [Halobacteriales archaeon SW_8_65_20]|nr:MAG: integrase [Halobacteriales archaeon SW_6_65_46]PSQ53596.1 MAG: integrase [Halobacteriales archaeon SW_8_65_20]